MRIINSILIFVYHIQYQLKISTIFRYKFVVADAVCEVTIPIKLKIDEYLKNPEFLCDVLHKGSLKAQERASSTMEEVFQKVGLGIPNLKRQKVRKSLLQ